MNHRRPISDRLAVKVDRVDVHFVTDTEQVPLYHRALFHIQVMQITEQEPINTCKNDKDFKQSRDRSHLNPGFKKIQAIKRQVSFESRL